MYVTCTYMYCVWVIPSPLNICVWWSTNNCTCDRYIASCPDCWAGDVGEEGLIYPCGWMIVSSPSHTAMTIQDMSCWPWCTHLPCSDVQIPTARWGLGGCIPSVPSPHPHTPASFSLPLPKCWVSRYDDVMWILVDKVCGDYHCPPTVKQAPYNARMSCNVSFLVVMKLYAQLQCTGFCPPVPTQYQSCDNRATWCLVLGPLLFWERNYLLVWLLGKNLHLVVIHQSL